MPLWLRNFTFNKILEAKQAESGANKKASQGKSTDIDLNSSIKAKIPKEALDSVQTKKYSTFNIDYPVNKYPEKPKSLNLPKEKSFTS